MDLKILPNPSLHTTPLSNGEGQEPRSGEGVGLLFCIMDLFFVFFKIGFFTLGGGYAMIPQIEAEIVDKRQWMKREEYLDLIAVAQSCPGALAVNMSIFIGYKLRKLSGALYATLGVALPSFVIILLIAMFFHKFQDNPVVASMFNGIRPAVVALIAAPVFSLARSARITITNCWIPIVSALLIWLLGVNPIYVLLAAGIFGYLYGLLIKPTE